MAAPASQAATADRPAVQPTGPRNTVSVIWLAMTAPAATRTNRLNRLPTEVWSLRCMATPIRDDPKVMQASSLREAGPFGWPAALDCGDPGGGSGRPPGCDPGHAIAAACVPQPKRAVGGRPLPAVPGPGYPP
jgi:hypothetical protein